MESSIKTIARNIRVKLAELGWELNDLARETKIHRATLSKIINDKQEAIRPANLREIAKALKVTPQWLEKATPSLQDLVVKPYKDLKPKEKSELIGRIVIGLPAMDDKELEAILRRVESKDSKVG